MSISGVAGRRLLVSVDAKGYSGNDDRGQLSMQDRLVAVLRAAAARSGLTRSTWQTQSAGDGELAILPESEPEPTVVDEYVRKLSAVLADHNHDLVERARLRLRMAIHHGIAIPADNGFAGRGVIVVSRLVDSQPVRRALVACPDADLAVVLSTRVFEDMIVQRATSLAARDFRRVDIVNKELDEPAWLLVPGFDVHAIDLTGSPSGPGGSPAGPDPTVPVSDAPLPPATAAVGVQNIIYGDLNTSGGYAIFGNNVTP